ncbi:hypothetical protein PENTCL1PPCAC_3104, partial [Pristionchus entomophagus]
PVTHTFSPLFHVLHPLRSNFINFRNAYTVSCYSSLDDEEHLRIRKHTAISLPPYENQRSLNNQVPLIMSKRRLSLKEDTELFFEKFRNRELYKKNY